MNKQHLVVRVDELVVPLPGTGGIRGADVGGRVGWGADSGTRISTFWPDWQCWGKLQM